VRALLHRLPVYASILACVLSVLACVFSGISSHQASVVTFDKKVLVGRFVGQLSALSLPDDAMRVKTDAFGRALTVSLSDYAKHHHVLILDKKQVLSGQNDITPDIARDVARHMRRHHVD
jgi:type-F conjugative transfer system protein TrbI